MNHLKLSLVSALILLPALSFANEQSQAELESLAKAAQNPIASMISLPFQLNSNLGIGPTDSTQNILNIQPVWPVEINDDWNLITRTIVPVVSNPNALTGEGRVKGIGDSTFTAFVSPSAAAKITWGVGPVFLLPTATEDALGQDTWGAGISAVVLAQPGNWVVGSLFSNVWSVGGGDADINLFTWQYFINYNLPNGWYLTSAPIITANWEADSDNRWTVPFGGGFGKIFHVGKQPINAQAGAYYNVEKPDSGADWELRLQLQFLFPK
jgi:hypothetical protein